MLRGTVRVTAAITGLLLVYGIVFALEGMTTRLPIAAARELVVTTSWTAPWMLLFCSGMEDLSTVVRKGFVLWLGALAAVLFLYYCERYTSSSFLTKVAMPPLAMGAGLLPHFFRRIRFVYVVTSVAAGVVAGFVLYNVSNIVLTPTAHFATKFIALEMVTFTIASIITGLLEVLNTYSKLANRVHA